MAIFEKENLYPLLFEPLYREVMWGGNKLQNVLGRQLPESDVPIGEAWEIVDREDATVSVVENGELKGKTLREILETFGKDIVSDSFQGGRFPLLIKLIDAGKRLSLQVHPDQEAAMEIGDGAEPKTEMWYIIAAEKGAKIMAGLKSNTTQVQFIDNINSPSIENCLQVFDSVPGDAYFINSGRIHAIGAGNLLLEIQQSSDTTYRVSDWGRVDADGNPRELHVDNALKCINFMDRTAPRIAGVSNSVNHNRKFPIIKGCPYFKVDDLRLVEEWIDNTSSTQSFHLITAINNPVKVGREEGEPVLVETGRTCLIPACFGHYTISLVAEAETTVIKTTL